MSSTGSYPFAKLTPQPRGGIQLTADQDPSAVNYEIAKNTIANIQIGNMYIGPS